MMLFTLSISVPYSNRAKTKELPSAEVEIRWSKPLMPEMAPSIGTVTLLITSSDFA
ncbi:hypothetical protein ES703_66924 [subsurface metagenome]